MSSGPRRVNHASVSIGDYIYSFGGYCSGEDYRLSRPMDVHVLNVLNLRWSLLPTRKDKKYPNVPFQRYGEYDSQKIYIFRRHDYQKRKTSRLWARIETNLRNSSRTKRRWKNFPFRFTILTIFCFSCSPKKIINNKNNRYRAHSCCIWT